MCILMAQMDIDAILGIINDEYLSSFEQTKRMDPPTLQSAVDAGEQQIEYEIGADENEDGKIRLSWGTCDRNLCRARKAYSNADFV